MRVLIDACVLYPTVMREMVVGAAAEGLFEAQWSARILEEWARAARKIGPEGETLARGESSALQANYPEALVAVPQDVQALLWLPDADDIHVLAAAVSCGADAILTLNAKDFPRGILAREGLQRLDPDAFMTALHADAPDAVQAVARRVLTEAQRLSGQAWDIRTLMRKARLPRLGKALAAEF